MLHPSPLHIVHNVHIQCGELVKKLIPYIEKACFEYGVPLWLSANKEAERLIAGCIGHSEESEHELVRCLIRVAPPASFVSPVHAVRGFEETFSYKISNACSRLSLQSQSSLE